MARLIYSAIMSVDGCIADESGRFDWAMPDEEVHSFINELERSAGTSLYGRRMYEVMAVWETMGSAPEEPPYIQDYARIWQAADKVVYSTTLADVSSARTRIERAFDPEAIRQMKADLERDILIGGPTLAAHAIEAGLVDEYQLFVAPVAVGGGLRFFPGGVRVDLTLLDERRFRNGMVYLRYGASGLVTRANGAGEGRGLTRTRAPSVSFREDGRGPVVSIPTMVVMLRRGAKKPCGYRSSCSKPPSLAQARRLFGGSMPTRIISTPAPAR